MRKLLILCLFFAAGCSSPPSIPLPADRPLVPYETRTPGAIVVPALETQPADIPVPSPTPFDYTIRKGDTLGSIADKYHVSLDALVGANPGINANAMRVGDALKIPSIPKSAAGQPTATPAPLSITQSGCRAMNDGTLWCFALARNDSPDPIDDVTAQFTVLDEKGNQRGSQTALLPIDVLPPGHSLPLSAFFGADVPADAGLQVQILTAISVSAKVAPYLDAAISSVASQVDSSGLSARVSGQLALPADSKPAATIWVAAVAYDDAGRVVGVKRWESAQGLQAGGTLQFAFILSAAAGPIANVDFAVEARP